MFASLKKQFGAWLILAEVAAFALIMFLAIPILGAEGGGAENKPWYTGFTPILILLGVIAIVLWRLPKVKEIEPGELAHLEVSGYRLRRAVNWLVLGSMYAFLYWGRYNLKPTIDALSGEQMYRDFNLIFSVGTAVYGLSFLINGPLTDWLGGRFSILVGTLGSCVANALMGLFINMYSSGRLEYNDLLWYLVALYGANMYFQSFGAVAIVKCNAAWFHVRERGVFGSIFGILISLGIYFAFDWSDYILNPDKLALEPYWACLAPAIALGSMFMVGLFVVKNRPSQAGFKDFHTGDASAGDEGENKKLASVREVVKIFALMFKKQAVVVEKYTANKVTETHTMMIRVVVLISCIEFCSGFLRQAVMQQYRGLAKSVGLVDNFVYQNWGLTLCIVGILGGVFAGIVSDRVFHSRRGPSAGLLYFGMLAGSIAMCFLLGYPLVGWVMAFSSLCVIGVHGMLSGTASMDFGGTKNVGIAVGIIDGFVYLGSSAQGWLCRSILPKGDNAAAKDPDNWLGLPVAMTIAAAVGLVLCWYIRDIKPKPKEKK